MNPEKEEAFLQEAAQKAGEVTKDRPVKVLKIGNNQNCLCGSKKKYKYCCKTKYNKNSFDIRKELPIV